MTQNLFDYIIAGGGMAGLSLAFYLNESSLRDKKILIIDREIKNLNDHTWCFWEKEKSAFEEIIFQKWNNVWFHGTNNFSEFLNLGKYNYKMIRAIDFYEFILSQIKQNPNFTFLRADIEKVENGTVKTDKGEFLANEFVFDSFTRKDYDNPNYQNLWQHFKGWVIKTDSEIFNPNEPTLFDFRVEQNNECRFAYVLPLSETTALIEFTIFSDNLLAQSEYETNLQNYITKVLQIKDFEIIATEYGVIPMSDEPHSQNPFPKVIRIGTAGGYVKSSTGYSFERTQRRLQKLVKLIETDSIQNPKSKIQNPKWKGLLDSILLNVLRTKKHSIADVFTYFFAKNSTSQVLKFLDEDTNLREDLRIMQTVPLKPFVRATLETIGKIFKNYFSR